MRPGVKEFIKDRKIEPFARWLVKRSRGIRMPLDLVKNEIYDRQALEVVQRVLAEDSNCVDVGCHKGEFLRQFLKYAPRGLHWAFEPIPTLAQRLRNEFPSARVFEVALSDKAGRAIFYIVPDAPALSGLNKREFLHIDLPRDEVTVRTETLDNLIPGEIKVDLIKIDVEGAEGRVISGALETIRRHRPFIIFEHGARSSAAFSFTSAQLYDLVSNQCGLGISLLPDWLSHRSPLAKQKFLEALQGEWYFLAHPVR